MERLTIGICSLQPADGEGPPRVFAGPCKEILERVSLTGAGAASCLAPLADANLQSATAKVANGSRQQTQRIFTSWLQEIVQFDRPAATKTGSGR
jgi:hypothetical protein